MLTAPCGEFFFPKKNPEVIMATRFNYVQTSQDDKISPVILGGRGKGYKWKGSKDSNDSGPKLAVQFVV